MISHWSQSNSFSKPCNLRQQTLSIHTIQVSVGPENEANITQALTVSLELASYPGHVGGGKSDLGTRLA